MAHDDDRDQLKVIRFKKARKWRLRIFREQVRTDCSHLGFLKIDKPIQQQLDAFGVLELLYINKIHRDMENEYVIEAEKQLNIIVRACKRLIENGQCR